jgi:hypothetical protein
VSSQFSIDMKYPLIETGRFTLSFLAHRIGERPFVFIATAGVSLPPSPSRPQLKPGTGTNPRAPNLVRTFDPRRFSRSRLLRPTTRAHVSMRYTHFPASHSKKDADLIAVTDRFGGEFGRGVRAVLDGYAGAERGDFCAASNLYCVVRWHVRCLVVIACAGGEGRLDGVQRSEGAVKVGIDRTCEWLDVNLR